jgi:Ca2+-binding EF-hand superfamily protein
MKPEDVRQLFDPALRDELSARDSAAFEAALVENPALAREFEVYADATAGVRDVDGWLRDAGRVSDVPDGGVYAAMTARIIQQATSRQRGRLIRLAAAVGAMAAAAAIIAVVFIRPGMVQQPVNDGAAVLAGQASDNDEESAKEKDQPKIPPDELKELRADWEPNGITRTLQDVRRADEDGKAIVSKEHVVEAWFEGNDAPFKVGDKLPGTKFTVESIVLEPAKAEVRVKHECGVVVVLQLARPAIAPAFARIDLNKDGKLDADEVPQFMLDEWDDDKSGTLDEPEFVKHHKPPVGPKPEDEFKRLDANGDGRLDGEEVKPPMLRDFDDDSSGDITLGEFRKHWKARPPRPEEAFKRLDRNADEALDAKEVPRAMLKDWDTDEDGRVTLEEFRANYKPLKDRRHGAREEPSNPPPHERPNQGEPPPTARRAAASRRPAAAGR